MKPDSRAIRFNESIGVTLLGFIFLPVAVFSLSLALGLGEMRWAISAAAIPLSLLFIIRLLKDEPSATRLAACSLPLGLAIFAYAACLKVYDLSFDGMTYDAGAILGLLRGYNPFHEKLDAPYNFWIEHYPKATWYFSAVFIHTTGHYQSGKIYNFILAFSVFFYVSAFFRQRGCSRSGLLLAGAAAANPIVTNQFFSYYVDGALGSLLTLLLFSAMNLMRAARPADRLVFVMSGCLILTTKFSAAAYLAVICLVSLAYLLRANRSLILSRLQDMSLIFMLGVLLIGFNPYVTNTLAEGHPMSPLMGPNKIDVISSNTPARFHDPELPNVAKLLISLFSESDDITLRSGKNPALKMPFSVRFSEIAAFKSVDMRIGGWGPLMSGIMLASLLVYICRHGWRQREGVLFIAMTVATILVNPHAWWARYTPQLALLPVLFLSYCDNKENPGQKIMPILLLCLLFGNSLLVFLPNLIAFHHGSRAMDRQAEAAVKACGKGDYDVYGATEFHYEPFTKPYGIIIRTPHWKENRPMPAQGLLPFREIFLYREGCNVRQE